jgi:hypothetical protein
VIFTSSEQTALSLRPPAQPLGTLLWDVRACDAAGNWSDWSTTRALLIMPKIPSAPALYAPLNGLAMMTRIPTLDWSDVIDGTMHEFQVSTSDTFKTLIQGGTTPSSEFTLISLMDGKYYWRVRSLNVDDEVAEQPLTQMNNAQSAFIFLWIIRSQRHPIYIGGVSLVILSPSIQQQMAVLCTYETKHQPQATRSRSG